MTRERPFSGPASVALAGISIVAAAGWSFANGLSRELRRPASQPTTAQVVLLTPKPAPAPLAPSAASLAYMAASAPVAPAPKPARHMPRRPAAGAHAADATPILQVEAPAAGPAGGVDAAVVAPEPSGEAPAAQETAPAG